MGLDLVFIAHLVLAGTPPKLAMFGADASRPPDILRLFGLFDTKAFLLLRLRQDTFIFDRIHGWLHGSFFVL